MVVFGQKWISSIESHLKDEEQSEIAADLINAA
jgi:hypothetical protein